MRRMVLVAATAIFCTNTILAGEKGDSAIFRHANVDEVVVTGVRNETDQRYTPFTVSQISRQQIESRYTTSLLDVINEQVPGFFSTQRGILGYGVSTGAAGQINIRGIGGSPSTGVMVLVDGHPQYMGIMGHPISDAYQSMLAEKVEVLRGPASMLYGGNAMGGVINIITRRTKVNGVRTDVGIAGGSYGTFTSEAVNRIRKDRFFSVASLSYNRTDGHRANTAFEQISGYLKLGYDLSQNWMMFGDINLTHFNASNPGSVYSPMIDNDQKITRGIASLAVRNNYEKTSGGASLFINWGRHKINDGYQEGGSPKEYYFRSKDHVAGANIYQSVSLFEGNRITAGFDLQLIGGNAWNDYEEMLGSAGAGRNTTLTDTTMTEVAGYLDFRQDIAEWLTAEAGLRIDHHSVAGTELVPQFGLSFRLLSDMSLKLTAGKGFRNPTLMNLFMFKPANADLKAERIWNYELAFAGKALDNRLRYGLNIYYLKGDNMIQTVAMKNVNTGEVENYGIELQGAFNINKHWQANANYSYIHKKHDITAVPRHKLYGEINYVNGPFSASVGADWINHLTTLVATDTTEGEQCSYVLVNARIAYRLCRWASLYVKGENLLAQKYEINYGYTMPRATFMAGARLHF